MSGTKREEKEKAKGNKRQAKHANAAALTNKLDMKTAKQKSLISQDCFCL